MGIASDYEYVIDLLVVHVLEETVSVGLIAVPRIVVDDETCVFGSLGCPSVIDSGRQDVCAAHQRRARLTFRE